jgi:membrane associated rhomboid family serine protease
MTKPASENRPASPPATFSLAGYKPLVISGAILVAVGLFVGLHTEPMPLGWDSYARWGAPSSNAIWNGAVWGLVTSSFVHLASWHLAFNLYWFWIVGRKIEFECGRLFTLFLLLTAAFASAVAEVSIGGNTGIGLSGVVYAFVGFIWVSARFDARFQAFISRKLLWGFLGWLLLCMVLTLNNVWQVGNAGHIGGLAWGAAIAWLHTRRPAWRYGLVAVSLGLMSVPILWAPWSVGWLSNRAYNLHMANNLPAAKHCYQLVLAKDSANEFAHQNLALIQLVELGQQARQAFEAGDLAQGKRLCQQMVRLEPTNEWALAMLAADAAPKMLRE